MRDAARFLATASPLLYLIGAVTIAAVLIYLVGKAEDRRLNQELEWEHQDREAIRIANSSLKIHIPDHVPDEWVS
jgi:hypothetical protein